MKKTIIAAVVGGLILFFWQFLSWNMLNLHASQQQYSPKQDQILTALNNIGLEEGEYVLPTYSRDATAEQKQTYMNSLENNPWAVLRYKKAFKNSLGLNIARSLIMNILIVFLLCYFIGGQVNRSFKKIFISSLGLGILSYLINPYLYSIWFGNTTIPDLIDAIVQFSLLGAWLGYMLKEKA